MTVNIFWNKTFFVLQNINQKTKYESINENCFVTFLFLCYKIVNPKKIQIQKLSTIYKCLKTHPTIKLKKKKAPKVSLKRKWIGINSHYLSMLNFNGCKVDTNIDYFIFPKDVFFLQSSSITYVHYKMWGILMKC